ncbi:hypothetical protein, partial [Foetidibacter luteolus]|uniref:hypothetical protein n=1 Tax=Foetidibacter luteolus TaxID=2608880 RepID=UPI001A9A076D
MLTSRDGIYWERDAAYQYYQHGPLSRTELGQLKVQGVDYVYTLQGWLKMINPTVAQTGGDNGNGQGCEPGTGIGNIIINKREDNTPPGYAATGEITFEEGFENGVEDYFDAVVDAALPPCNSPNPNGNINTGNTARDAYNVLLNYYTDDYKGIGYSAPTVHAYLQQQNEYRPLYNGNISSMGVNVEKLGSPLLYNYHYDQLNRLVGMQAHQSGNAVWAGLGTIPDFKEAISYDPNGNILSYDRNGNNTFAGKPLAMDKLGYRYKPNTNQLDHITDDVNAANYTEDIDGQGTNNYEYDEIGNLVKDKAEGIGQSQQSKIEWTVYGKISSI